MEGSTSVKAAESKFKINAYAQWFLERFPPINFVSAYLLFVFIYVYSNSLNDLALSWTIKEFVLGLGLLSQLLLLRLLDEFKDHAYDQKYHPDRVIQQGIISLEDLKILVILSVCVQVLLNIVWGNPLNIFWFSMMLWTFLMTKEFFLGEWLRKRVFLYLLSHMLVMVFLVLWIFSFYTYALENIWPAVTLIFLGSILYEITRKSRGLDEDERLDSYPKEVGFTGNSLILLTLTSLVFIFKYLFITEFNHWVYAWDVLAGLAFTISIIIFQIKKNKKSRKILEANYGGFMMAIYMSFILRMVFF